MVPSAVRREIHFRGRVQGVGFRATTRDIAGRFRVAGYVENLPDGRVRLVIEGAAAELDRFVEALEVEMGQFIAGSDCAESRATGEFDDFGVRH